jgi:hypothetical protein
MPVARQKLKTASENKPPFHHGMGVLLFAGSGII